MAESNDAPPVPDDDTPDLARFEAAVAELEGLVEAMESGELTLEQALTKFERGVHLARQCQHLLKSAELRVDQLLADDSGERVADFAPKTAPDTPD